MGRKSLKWREGRNWGGKNPKQRENPPKMGEEIPKVKRKGNEGETQTQGGDPRNGGALAVAGEGSAGGALTGVLQVLGVLCALGGPRGGFGALTPPAPPV